MTEEAGIPGPGIFLQNLTVLARNYSNNFYYSGRVVNQINAENFLVELDVESKREKDKNEFQETHIIDLIAFDDSKRHPIAAFDNVLIPENSVNGKYIPAVVTSLNDEDGGPADEIEVKLANDQTQNVLRLNAVWISPNLYDRLKPVCVKGEGPEIRGNLKSTTETYLFENINEKNVVFCINTSASMFDCLEEVKDQLIATLEERAKSDQPGMFNIIEFSGQATAWADKCVLCNLDTVKIASEWLRNVQPKSTSNVLDALLTALNDHEGDCVCLVTDSLPDDHPENILDHVIPATNGRPVHCYFLEKKDCPENATITNFLSQLASESYGTLNLVTTSCHKHLEHITTVCSPSTSTVISSDRQVHHLENRLCSISTNIEEYPDQIIIQPPVKRSVIQQNVPSCYYSDNSPSGWVKYTPPYHWSTTRERIVDTAGEIGSAEDAGRLITGSRVLARKHDDGYFYFGNVKSHLLDDKFLIEFVSSKKSRPNSSILQETLIYDIVSFEDAKRHPIVPSDHVLAPVDGKGKYGPGIVLTGSEKTDLISGPLIVKFVNGQTSEVSSGLSVWISGQFYNRISFELNLPKALRSSPANPPNPSVYQKDFDRYNSVTVEKQDGRKVRGLYRNNTYFPMHEITSASEENKDPNSLIPGTDMTLSQLNSLVSTQITEHKHWLENGTRSKLLHRREVRPNSSLKKSVTFDSVTDSGRGSASDNNPISDAEDNELDLLDLELEMDRETKEKEKEIEQVKQKLSEDVDRERSPSPSSMTRRCRRVTKPRWKYWKNEPAPSLTNPYTFSSGYRPFRETLLQAPLEARDNSLRRSGGWTDSVYQSVQNPGASGPSVKDAMGYKCDQVQHVPQPPTTVRYVRSSVPPDHYEPTEEEKKQEFRQEFKRQQVARRSAAEEEAKLEFARRKAVGEQNQRRKIMERLDKDKEKRAEMEKQIEQQTQNKRRVVFEIRSKYETMNSDENNRKKKRLVSMKIRREEREIAEIEKTQEQEQIMNKRQEARQQRVHERNMMISERLVEEERSAQQRDRNKRQAKLQRIEHFRQLENEGQELKDRRIQSAQQQLALQKSRIFP